MVFRNGGLFQIRHYHFTIKNPLFMYMFDILSSFVIMEKNTSVFVFMIPTKSGGKQ